MAKLKSHKLVLYESYCRYRFGRVSLVENLAPYSKHKKDVIWNVRPWLFIPLDDVFGNFGSRNKTQKVCKGDLVKRRLCVSYWARDPGRLGAWRWYRGTYSFYVHLGSVDVRINVTVPVVILYLFRAHKTRLKGVKGISTAAQFHWAQRVLASLSRPEPCISRRRTKKVSV
jgi:hypothetical protein